MQSLGAVAYIPRYWYAWLGRITVQGLVLLSQDLPLFALVL